MEVLRHNSALRRFGQFIIKAMVVETIRFCGPSSSSGDPLCPQLSCHVYHHLQSPSCFHSFHLRSRLPSSGTPATSQSDPLHRPSLTTPSGFGRAMSTDQSLSLGLTSPEYSLAVGSRTYLFMIFHLTSLSSVSRTPSVRTP